MWWQSGQQFRGRWALMSSTPAVTVALLSDHPGWEGISSSRTRWVVEFSVAGQLSTNITWICKVYPVFSHVKHWKWWSSFPSFLWPYTAVIFSPSHDFLHILKPVRILLIHHPQQPPSGSFHLVTGQESTLAPCPWLSSDTAGLASSYSQFLPGHSSWSLVHPKPKS